MPVFDMPGRRSKARPDLVCWPSCAADESCHWHRNGVWEHANSLHAFEEAEMIFAEVVEKLARSKENS